MWFLLSLKPPRPSVWGREGEQLWGDFHGLAGAGSMATGMMLGGGHGSRLLWVPPLDLGPGFPSSWMKKAVSPGPAFNGGISSGLRGLGRHLHQLHPHPHWERSARAPSQIPEWILRRVSEKPLFKILMCAFWHISRTHAHRKKLE